MSARQGITELHNANRTELEMVTGFVHPKRRPSSPNPNRSDQDEDTTTPAPGTKRGRSQRGKRAEGSPEHIKGHGSTRVGQQAKPYEGRAVSLG